METTDNSNKQIYMRPQPQIFSKKPVYLTNNSSQVQIGFTTWSEADLELERYFNRNRFGSGDKQIQTRVVTKIIETKQTPQPDSNPNPIIPEHEQITWVLDQSPDIQADTYRVRIANNNQEYVVPVRDINIIIAHTKCSESQAIRTLINEQMDLVRAIINLTDK